MTATVERPAPESGTPHLPSPVNDVPVAGASRRTWALATLAVLALLWAALWIIDGQIDKPYVYDDVNFILGARAVADAGRPFGNQGYLLHLVTEREQWALWHPPLYMYLLGLTVALFGDGERASRGFSVLCMLIAAGFSFDLARRTVLLRGGSPERGLAAGVLTIAIYVLNPLTIQAAQVLDIDNTILMVLIVAVCWMAVRLPGSWSARIIVGLALLYALSLWAKLTTPLALGVALAFTRLFQTVGWRGALQAVGVVALGWVIFLVTWVSISGMAGFPLDYTLEVVHNEALESGISSGHRLVSLHAFVFGVGPAILWIGPFFCLLFVAAGLPRLWSLLRGKGLDAADILVVLGAAIYLAYIFKLAGNFPKYHAGMLPLWAAASGVLVARVAGRPTLTQYAVAALGMGLLVWWFPARLEDAWNIVWEITLNTELILIPMVIGLGVAVLWALVGRRNLLGALPVALLVVTLSWSASLSYIQRDRKGSSTYFYGRIGQREAADAISAMLRPGEVYVASKEVAWYASEHHYVDQESWQHVIWDLNGATFDGTYQGHPIRILALEIGEESHKWAYDVLLLRNGYQHAGLYGNFQVYLKP